jgi:hydroxyacylglutathione hydrolase
MKNWTLNNGYQLYRLLSGRSNSYLICTTRENILVDSGKKNKRSLLLENLKKLHVDKVDWLILTHTHFDHCENARFLQNKFNCKIVVSDKGYPMAERGYAIHPRGTNPFTKIISQLGNLFFLRLSHYQRFIPDHTYDEFFSFSIPEINIDLLATPGHSDDSISVIVYNEIALVGDAMFGIFKNSIFPPFADDPAEMVESWAKLLDSNCHTFLPGHGSEIKRELIEREMLKYPRK